MLSKILSQGLNVRNVVYLKHPLAFCESLEETHLRLQSELADKQREADRLKKTLEERENCLNLLLKEAK